MKNTLKKVLFSLGTIGLVGVGTLGLTNAQSLILGGDPNSNDATQGENFGDYVGQDKTYNPGSGSDNFTGDNLMNTIKRFINWLLGSLSLIALVLCLRGGFQMLTASGDETKYKKGFTILKQAGIGLAVIALSWMIVSIIFRIIGKSAGGDSSTSSSSSSSE